MELDSGYVVIHSWPPPSGVANKSAKLAATFGCRKQKSAKSVTDKIGNGNSHHTLGSVAMRRNSTCCDCVLGYPNKIRPCDSLNDEYSPNSSE